MEGKNSESATGVWKSHHTQVLAACYDMSFKETWPGFKTLKLRVSANSPQSSCYLFNQP